MLAHFVAKGEGFHNPIAIAFAVSFGLFGAIFMLVEGFWSAHPLIPLPLLAGRRVEPFLAVQALVICAKFTVRPILVSQGHHC